MGAVGQLPKCPAWLATLASSTPVHLDVANAADRPSQAPLNYLTSNALRNLRPGSRRDAPAAFRQPQKMFTTAKQGC